MLTTTTFGQQRPPPQMRKWLLVLLWQLVLLHNCTALSGLSGGLGGGGAGLSPASAVAVAAAEAPLRICEPIRIDLCRGIGYNETAMPNLVGHEVQSDADFTLHTFLPLIQYGCSAQLHFFLCAAYLPMCTPKVRVPIGPCRNLCETVRARCHPVLQGFGFPWPAALDCARFPADNNHEHMCMEGPGEPGDTGGEASGTGLAPAIQSATGGAASVAASGSGGLSLAAGGGGAGLNHPMNTHLQQQQQQQQRHFTCQGLAKAHLYVRLNRSAVRCAALCEANILFDAGEKAAAEVWVTVWSVAALVTAVTATLCLIVSDTKWDHILVPLVTCGSLVTVGWTVRWLAGRSRTACGVDAQFPGVSLLLVDGMGNAPCAVTFLLRYYFGMAANVWWAILCLKWHFSVRRGRLGDYVPASSGGGSSGHHQQHHQQPPSSRRGQPDVHIELMAVNGGGGGGSGGAGDAMAAGKIGAANKAAVGAGAKADGKCKSLRGRMRGADPVAYCSLTHLVAWGLPVVQTVSVVMAQLVDADELLGSCFVGNQSDKALRVLVAMPLFCYWIFGSVNLFAGYLVQRREQQQQQQHQQQQQQQQQQLINPHQAAVAVTASTGSATPTTIGGMGVFLFIYSVPSAALMIAVFYEFANRDIWLNDSTAGSVAAASSAVKAAMWPFLLRAFMELLVGVLASGWVLGPRVSTLWRALRSHWLAIRTGPPTQKIGAATGGLVSPAPSHSASHYRAQPVHHQSHQSMQPPLQMPMQHPMAPPHLQATGSVSMAAPPPALTGGHQLQLHSHQHHLHNQHNQFNRHSGGGGAVQYPHPYPLSMYSTASYQSVMCPQNSMVSLTSTAMSRSNGGGGDSVGGGTLSRQHQHKAMYSTRPPTGGGGSYPAAGYACRPKSSKKRTAGYRRSGQSTAAAAATAGQSVALMSAAAGGNESML